MTKPSIFRTFISAMLFAGIGISFFYSCTNEEDELQLEKFNPSAIVFGCKPAPTDQYLAYQQMNPGLEELKAAKAYVMLCTPAVGNQGSEGSCTSWGTTYSGLTISRGCLMVYSQEFVYNTLKTCSDCSCGLYVADALNLLKSSGTCSYNLMPSVTGCGIKPNDQQRAEAVTYKINNWYTLGITVNNIKAKLNSGQPVIVAGPVNNDYMNLANGAVLGTFNGTNLGYHCYIIVGYDDAKNAFKFMNSWGTGWASGGFGWINYNNLSAWVKEAYWIDGSRSFVSWQSYNFPGSYIRHMNSRGRIDANISPIDDKNWTMVPGLAGTGVSFQSKNYPNKFLRHRNGEIWMDANDGSQLFRADATFIQVAGLADGSKVSFKSYNFSNNYIRHRNSLLYSEPVNNDLGRRDATFGY
ncbi:MAG: AbfB domain-containing protein [Bacteroidales bacterium]|nr:AbfB domain-containing protein [Bacteroidales bacterium]